MKPRWPQLLVAALFIAAGLFPMLIALGLFPALDSLMNAPRWVAFTAGSLFFIVGMAMAAVGVAGELRAGPIVAAALLAIVAGAALVTSWIAFGSGPRACGGGIALFGFSSARDMAETECRAGFGYSAVLLNLITLRGIGEAWLIVAPTSHVAQSTCKWIERGILLALLPLILLALIPGLARELRSKAAARFRKGAPDAGPRRPGV